LWDAAGVTAALHVVLASQRRHAVAGPAELAGDQREVEQGVRIVGPAGVLRHTHPRAHEPENTGCANRGHPSKSAAGTLVIACTRSGV
jgi:hypothetical protein